MNNKVLFIAAVILVGVLSTNLLIKKPVPPAQDVELVRNEPDLYMLNATITQFDEKGELQHEIQAARFTHFPLTDLTVLKAPFMNLFSENRELPWEITADNGRLLPGSVYREEVIELWDNVDANREKPGGEFINIQSETMTVYPNRDYAETNRKVQINDDTGETTAAGMQAYFDTGRFLFYSSGGERVHSKFQPVNRTP